MKEKRDPRQNRSGMTVFLSLLFYFSFSSPLWSCPVCADVLSRGRDAIKSIGLAEGLFISIVFMLMVPAAIAAGLYFHFKKRLTEEK